jgi:uncharacterized membrane protein
LPNFHSLTFWILQKLNPILYLSSVSFSISSLLKPVAFTISSIFIPSFIRFFAISVFSSVLPFNFSFC